MASMPPAAPHPPSPGRPRVLLVDDDEDTREAVAGLLADEGYPVALAPDGATALRLAREGGGAFVILLDHLLPDMDGLAVLRALAADPAPAHRHVALYFTAIGGRQLSALQPALDDLRVEVVHKPFEVDALLDAVARASARLTPGAASPGGAPAP